MKFQLIYNKTMRGLQKKLYLALLYLTIAMLTTAFSMRVSAQGVSMTVVVTDATCNEADGTLEVTINNAVTPIWFTVIFNNNDISGFPYTGSTTYFYIQNLMSGIYTLRVKAANSDTITENHEILEPDALWPALPENNIRAVAVDLAVDYRLNVVSCGYWTGRINFNPPNSNDEMLSIGPTAVYIAKYDPCGKFMWSVNVNGACSTDYCQVNALHTDINNDIIACGTFSGDIHFPPNNNITLSADPNKPGSAWAAKFDETTGDCLWAVLFSSEHGVQAKDVCAYSDGNIFIAGDFLGDDIDLYDVTNNSPHTLYNTYGGYYDAFIAAYDEDGYYLDSDLLAGTSADDVAGGLCCFESNQGASIAEIITTGVMNGDYWLGQRWYHNPMTGLAKITDFNLYSGGTPIDQYKVGMTAEPYILNGQQSFVFAGYVLGTNGTYPWVASAITPSTVQSTQSTTDYLAFIGDIAAENFNIANAITINQPASAADPSLFFGGIVNNEGDHPLGSQNNVPAATDGDFFVDKFKVTAAGIDDPDWSVYSDSHTSNYGQDPFSTPYYLGLGCDHFGRVFLTASYLDNISTGFGLDILSTGASGVFIARIMETTTGGGWFKNLISPQVETKSGASFSFYPNPATSEIILLLPAQTLRINVFSIDGRLLRSTLTDKPGEGQQVMDTGFLMPGAYLIQVETSTGPYTRKLIKQ